MVPEAAVAIEFDGPVRSLGVRFVRPAAEDLGTRQRPALAARVRRALAEPGPATRDFGEVVRAEGRSRSEAAGDDGWLRRADDRVGGRRTPMVSRTT